MSKLLEINELIYQLYMLSKEEIKVIEDSFVKK